MAGARRAAPVAIVAALCAAGCTGEGPALPDQAATTARLPAATSRPSPAVAAVDRNDPAAVGRAFIAAWRVGDAARMRSLAQSADAVDRALRLPAEAGEVTCQAHRGGATWQCDIGPSTTPLFVLIDQDPIWAVSFAGRSTGD